MTAKIDGTNGVLQQYDYQVPTTGFSYTFAAGTTVLVMNPAGTLATGTITMPAAPADGMTISFSSTKAITALTVNANTGQSIVGNPTTILAGGAATFVYRLSNTTWYTQLNTAAIGGTPVVTIYTSPATWTKPATIKAVKVTVVGGGGGGGNVVSATTATGGTGGLGGVIYGYAQAPAVPAPQAITVGTGGGAQAAGGTSSFGAIFSTTGGSGGTQGSGQAAPGGSFAIASTATSSSLSLTNGPAFNVAVFGVPGSAPPASNGTNGTGYGSGGGGGNNNNGPAKTGGSGTGGFVIVEEFY